MTKLKAAFAWLLFAAGVYAQANLATLTGVVTDTANAVMPGVSLTVRNTETNLVRTARTTVSGDFTITNLPPRSYELTGRHKEPQPSARTAGMAVNWASLIAVHSPFRFNNLRPGEVVLYRVFWGAKSSKSPVEASFGFSFESLPEFESAVFASMSNGWRKSPASLPCFHDAPFRTQFSKPRCPCG